MSSTVHAYSSADIDYPESRNMLDPYALSKNHQAFIDSINAKFLIRPLSPLRSDSCPETCNPPHCAFLDRRHLEHTL
jgi:hypothetical protein